MEKRGQITIFIIIAILLAASVFGFLTIRNKLKNSAFVARTEDVYSSVEICMEEVTSDGVTFISSRGGYFNLPNSYFDMPPATSYWISKCEDTSPDTDLIEEELAKYIEEQIKYCLDSQTFQNKKVEFGTKDARIIMKEGVISLKLRMKTVITTNKSTDIIKNYQIEFKDDKLLNSFTISKNILNEISKDPDTLSFSQIFSLADQEEFNININSYDEEDYLFQLSMRSQGEYIFNFAVNLEC